MKNKLVAQLRELRTTIADELAQALEEEQTHALSDKPGHMTGKEFCPSGRG